MTFKGNASFIFFCLLLKLFDALQKDIVLLLPCRLLFVSLVW